MGETGGGGLWSILTIVGPLVIAACMIYGIRRASNRRKLTAQEREAGDAKTRQMYRGSDD